MEKQKFRQKNTTLISLTNHNDRTANTISYMLAGYRDWPCAGLWPIQSNRGYDSWGALINDKYYCGVFINDQKCLDIMSDDAEKESILIDLGYHYICVFRGSDNTSYMKRFVSSEALHEFIMTATEVTDDDMELFYNS